MAARGTIIHDAKKLPDGKVQIAVREGDLPTLPAWDGSHEVFATVDDFVARLEQAEAVVAAELKYVKLASGYKKDPTLGAVFENTVKTGTASIDLTGISATVTI